MLPPFLRPRRWAPVPRAQAHRLLLAMPRMADRQLQAAVGLQVQRLHGRGNMGYCWRRQGDEQVEVWYWDEAASAASASVDLGVDGRQPCPENLLKAPPPDGFALTRCVKGLEATFCRGGRLEKTRWFPGPPSEVDWAWFVQDAGQSPADAPVPRVREGAPLARPAPEWAFFTNLLKPLSRAALAGVAVATLAGGALAAAGVYDLKLSRELERVQAQRSTLAQEAATAVKLQAELNAITEKVAGLSAQQAPVLQLQALARLANSGLVGEGAKVYLLEWEFRNDRLRMLFAVPSDKFVLTDFLANIEKIGVFTDVRLVPGTTGQTVGLQAGLQRVPSIAELMPVAEASSPETTAAAATPSAAAVAAPQGKR